LHGKGKKRATSWRRLHETTPIEFDMVKHTQRSSIRAIHD
jgi:hypothetical protein